MKTIEAYKCDYCGKVYQRKYFAIEHEKICPKKPENIRVCYRCDYLGKVDAIHHIENEYIEENTKVNIFYCKKIHSFLYPYSKERSRTYLREDLTLEGYECDEVPNNPMKNKCQHFIEPTYDKNDY